MAKLVVTADAENDTREILEYLTTEAGPRVAEKFGRRFRLAIERFVAIPGVGSPRPSLGTDIRISVVFPYVLIYAYEGDSDTVTLLRILHGRRNFGTEDLSGQQGR
jgi:plasmid stabilization system protein ParE